MSGIEAAFAAGYTGHAPGVHRLDDAFERMFTKVSQVERAADQAACVRANDDLISFC